MMMVVACCYDSFHSLTAISLPGLCGGRGVAGDYSSCIWVKAGPYVSLWRYSSLINGYLSSFLKGVLAPPLLSEQLQVWGLEPRTFHHLQSPTD